MSQLWVVQSNLRDHEQETLAVVDACQKLLLTWAGIPLLPFEEGLREVPWASGPRVYYGSVSLTKRLRPGPTTWFDPKTFRPSVWGKAFGSLFLNHDARYVTLREFLEGGLYHPKERVFLRPDADLKDFVGWTRIVREVERYLEGQSGGWTIFTKEMPVVVASPKEILAETRVWMVNGEAVAAVRYREKGERVAKPVDLQAASDTRLFAEACAARHSPAPVFVLDVAHVPGDLKVVEVNAFHASGFYSPEVVLPVIREVSNYVAAYCSTKE